MTSKLDTIIIGSGPGGLSAALLAQKTSKSYLILEKGIFAIGGAISPSYMGMGDDGIIKEKKHSNLIYTALWDTKKEMDKVLQE
jgi:thioredoxin reductase